MAQKKLKVPEYPDLFKHMVLAIFRGKTLTGTPNSKFNSAMEIALSRLKEYKLLEYSSSLVRMTLTGHGRKLNLKHVVENASTSKGKLFDAYYQQFAEKGEAAEPNEDAMEQGGSFAPKKVLEEVGPQPRNVVLRPKFDRVKPKKPSRLMPTGNPVRPKNTPNRPQKVKTAQRVSKVRRATKR